MRSITYGEVNFEQIFNLIKNFVNKAPKDNYQITVGTDSQNFDLTKTVIVIAVHHVGHGGIFFYEIKRVKKITNIRQKLFYETSMSIELATRLLEKFLKENFGYSIGVHVDAGQNGPTSKVIPEITAWVESCGFHCKTKPESYAASAIADKYSK